jgi:hypothetical protein
MYGSGAKVGVYPTKGPLPPPCNDLQSHVSFFHQGKPPMQLAISPPP